MRIMSYYGICRDIPSALKFIGCNTLDKPAGQWFERHNGKSTYVRPCNGDEDLRLATEYLSTLHFPLILKNRQDYWGGSCATVGIVHDKQELSQVVEYYRDAVTSTEAELCLAKTRLEEVERMACEKSLDRIGKL